MPTNLHLHLIQYVMYIIHKASNWLSPTATTILTKILTPIKNLKIEIVGSITLEFSYRHNAQQKQRIGFTIVSNKKTYLKYQIYIYSFEYNKLPSLIGLQVFI